MPLLDLNTHFLVLSKVIQFMLSLNLFQCYFSFFFLINHSALGSPTLTEVIQYLLDCLGLLQAVLETKDVVRLVMGYDIFCFQAATLQPMVLRSL